MKRQIKPIMSMAIAVAFLLSACSSATPTPASVATTEPVRTVAPAQTTAAEVPTEAATMAVTTEATTEMTGTVEATPEMTGTMEATGEATMEATGEATMEATSMATTEAMTVTGMMTSTSMTTATKNIVETAMDTGEFMSLTAALKSAGLVETLKGKGPFTVFAPTDKAFAKLDSSTIDMLMNPANRAELTKILTYHVVKGSVMAADVAGMTTADTLEGSPITITVSGGEVKINNATIVMTDIVASNGVIHVIDTVLMPPDVKAP